jgi:Reverse transcriptase (RNA-dependent DNA polymerase)
MAGGGDLTVEQVAELTGMGVKWQWLRAQVSQRGLKKWASAAHDPGIRRSLAGFHNVALVTDLVSFFASIPVPQVQEAIQDRTSGTRVVKRLCDFLEGFAQTPNRSGLPQRSTASAVIANMYLAPLDDVLKHHAKSMPRLFKSRVTHHSFARWMDDMWLFGGDPAAARRAQMEIQASAQTLGLNLNFAKTSVLEGDDVEKQALEVEHSAVDDAIDGRSDFGPLEALIDRLLENPEKAGRTSVKFATKRMRDNNQTYRAADILQAAKRMPHVADALSRLFREQFRRTDLQDWYLEYAVSDWATHQWCVAYYGRMFPSGRAPKKALREFFAERVRDANTELTLLSVAAQRLAAWDPAEARTAANDAYRRAATPHARRVLALTALSAGETRTKVRKWLAADLENQPTLKMLEDYGWAGPKVQTDFAK